MNRLEKQLTELNNKKQKGLVLYISAGDPDLDTTLEIMNALAENGVDCIELGVPFSDPIADGPVIQRASQRALENDINLDSILGLVRKFRQKYATPVLLMGYYNSFYQYGLETFTGSFQTAGGDGLIIADLPWEESEELEGYCSLNDLSLIRLLAPEMNNERTQSILRSANGFIYCVSNYGTTGADSGENAELKEIIQSFRQETDTPVAIGFGISSVDKAVAAANMADCVIVGSWLIAELEKATNKPARAAEFTSTLKKALG